MKNGNRYKSLLLAAALTMCQAAAFAQVTGKEAVQELFTLFSAWSSPQNKAHIFEEAAHRIDYATMAETAFTPAQWDSFTPSQKRDLIQSFQVLVENRYYQRWHKLFLRSHLSITGEAKAGADTYVKTHLTEGKDDDTVIWKLRSKGGEPMIISLDVNGKDLVGRLSERFQRQLKKRGPQGLITWIKDKADVDEDEGNNEAASNSRREAAK